MSKILQYREANDLTRDEAAALFGVSAEFIRLLENGQRQASAKLAIRMEEVTQGALRRSDTRPDLWPENDGGFRFAAASGHSG